MSKQTSVDFLLKEFSAIFGKVNFTAMQGLLMKDAVEKAKEMHEVEIIDAASDHCYPTRELARIDAENYYNETYKKDK